MAGGHPDGNRRRDQPAERRRAGPSGTRPGRAWTPGTRTNNLCSTLACMRKLSSCFQKACYWVSACVRVERCPPSRQCACPALDCLARAMKAPEVCCLKYRTHALSIVCVMLRLGLLSQMPDLAETLSQACRPAGGASRARMRESRSGVADALVTCKNRASASQSSSSSRQWQCRGRCMGCWWARTTRPAGPCAPSARTFTCSAAGTPWRMSSGARPERVPCGTL